MHSVSRIFAVAGSLLAAGCFATPAPHNPRQSSNEPLHTWWHEKAIVNTDGVVAADEVRQSRKFNVSVALSGQDSFSSSFVYETIPRNGNGQMYDPAEPSKQYNLTDGDGITVEVDAGINMAWTQFEYSEDVHVRITSKDGSSLGPASNVIIRPTDTQYEITSPTSDTVVITVPYDSSGRRFSVEFQDDLFTYRSDGSSYVSDGGLVVSEEPRNALVIFASPFIPSDMIPSKTSADTQVLEPGAITDTAIGPQPTLYFQAGVYWTDSDGFLGKGHIKLDSNTHYVYFEPGTYIKGAFEYTTANSDFYTVGHGVVSGENYAYMANTQKGYVAEKDDRHSLRMFSHHSVTNDQKWHCMGPTVNAPPFNTVDLYPSSDTGGHEENNRVKNDIADYKQVGAFYFQTDGPQIYAGTVKDCFWHVNDDAIKLYHSDAIVHDITVWKCHNDPVIQMGWSPRDVSNTTVARLNIIHSRWFKSETGVPSAIIGASPFYSSPQSVNASKTMNAKILDVRCEGSCPALLRIAPLQNYDLSVDSVSFDGLLNDDNIKLGRSLVGVNLSDEENNEIDGQEGLTVGINISDWQVRGEKVDSSNYQANQLGQLDINQDLANGFTII